jgi:hypothetical protein
MGAAPSGIVLTGAGANLSVPGGSSQAREKLLITGDDVLIEYVHRLMLAV